ncbi:MAG TPA: thymidylate synthase [bacterium]
MVQYKPFHERTPDSQYRDLLQRILETGEEVVTRQGVPALRIVGHLLRFDLANGFPIITERDLVSAPNGRPSAVQQALGEICAFLNGAQTQRELEEFGCYWWADWVTAAECAKFGLSPGDLGPASYGAAFRRFPTAEGGAFDQVTHLVEQIKTHPHLRHHEITPWIPQYLAQDNGRIRRAVVPPCHGWVHVNVNPRTRTLILTHRQRSADVPVGLVFNFIHYAALALMIGQVTGYRPVELVYFIDDAHVYLTQTDAVRSMLTSTPQPFPTVDADPSVADLFAFRAHHFTVTDYHPQSRRRRIPTPV